MSIIAVGLNLLLVVLIGAALFMGWRLNRRLKALRDSHDGFAKAVAELNTAARRAEQGLADLRAVSDEAGEELGARVESARSLAARLERLIEAGGSLAANAPAADEQYVERRLGALLASVQQPRTRPEPAPERPAPRRELLLRTPTRLDDDLFDEPAERAPMSLGGLR